MAAGITSLVRMMSGGGYKEDQPPVVNESTGLGNKSTVLITRDLLGGCSSPLDSRELDLDLQVPSGWEKRLDLKSGKVYLQRCSSSSSSSKNTSPSSSSSSSDRTKHQTDKTVSKLQDLNLFPSSSSSSSSLKQPLNLLNDSNLDLKLVSSLSSASPYQSVCTLDKVKFALERAEKETMMRKRSSMSISGGSPSSSSESSRHSNFSSSMKESEMDLEDKSSSFAAGCPSCLLYVLISKSNPRCPRCHTIVPSPAATIKRPRFDLNIAI